MSTLKTRPEFGITQLPIFDKYALHGYVTLEKYTWFLEDKMAVDV